MTLQQFADIVAGHLGIACPEISFVSELATPTQLGAYSPEDKTLYIKESASPLDQALTVAHELRHVWQERTGWTELLDHRSPVGIDAATYNMQPEEIDAHAFSAIVLVDAFGVKPLFNGLPPEVLGQIEDRIREIVGGDRND